MKERIDEYDMAKKMMSILRGGYKPLLNEFINAPDLNTDQTQGSVNDNQLGDDQNNTNNQNNNQNMAKRLVKVVNH
jgi:lysophospholipase L1-like esterase